MIVSIKDLSNFVGATSVATRACLEARLLRMKGASKNLPSRHPGAGRDNDRLEVVPSKLVSMFEISRRTERSSPKCKKK
jgi:hypothetical protein